MKPIDEKIFWRHMIDLLVMGCLGTAVLTSFLLVLGKIPIKDHLFFVGLGVGSLVAASTCQVYKNGKINQD